MKRKLDVVPGIEYVLRGYHSGLLQIMEQLGQTQAQAAKSLGISVPTFQKMLRLRWQLDFHSSWGQDLSISMERWSGVPIDELFPPAFFTREYVKQDKTLRGSKTFALLMQGGSRNRIPLKLADLKPAHASPPKTKKKRKKRRPMKK